MYAAAILAGLWQILFGWRKLGRYMKYVPKPVMVGFVNALAILIFMAQWPQFHNANWTLYAFVAAGLVHYLRFADFLLNLLPEGPGQKAGPDSVAASLRLSC